MTTTGKKRLTIEYNDDEVGLIDRFKGVCYTKGLNMQKVLMDFIRQFIKKGGDNG